MDRPTILAHSGFALDCGRADCDICTLAPLPDEAREDWIARLREQFLAQAIPGPSLGRPSMPTWDADEWDAALAAIAAERPA